MQNEQWLLILGAVLFPLIWGWGMYRLVAWLWPVKANNSGKPGAEMQPSSTPIDYQI